MIMIYSLVRYPVVYLHHFVGPRLGWLFLQGNVWDPDTSLEGCLVGRQGCAALMPGMMRYPSHGVSAWLDMGVRLSHAISVSVCHGGLHGPACMVCTKPCHYLLRLRRRHGNTALCLAAVTMLPRGTHCTEGNKSLEIGWKGCERDMC